MDDISSFRGVSGDVVREFLKFSTFVTLFPILIFWGFFYGISSLSKNIPDFIMLLLNTLAFSLLISRFAIPASKGELHKGVFNMSIKNGDTLAFVARYFMYTFIWLIPTLLLIHFVLDNNSLIALLLSGFSFIGTGINGLVLAVVMLMSIFGPTLCCILSTKTTSFVEVLSLDPISWIYHERREDLGPFYASIIGGLILFYAKYLVPLLLIDYFLLKNSEQAGTNFAIFIQMLPFLVSPILIGRLSGAFIVGEEPIEELANLGEQSSKANSLKDYAANLAESANVELKTPTYSATQKKSYEHIANNIDSLNETEINEAIQNIESMPQNVYTLLQLSYLYKKTNRAAEALEKANTALQNCLDHAMGYEAVKLFKYFSKDKGKFKLDNDQLHVLAAHLSHQQFFMDAAWCYLLSMTLIKDEDERLLIQKKLVNLANEASQKGHLETALNLYNFFIEHYADSTLIDFVKTAAASTKEKIEKQ